MTSKASKFLSYVSSQVWAIMQSSLDEFVSRIAVAYDTGSILTVGESYDAMLERGRYDYEIVGGVAVITLSGVVEKEYSLWTHFLGGISTEFTQRTIEAAASDPAVEKIVLKIDSPGGTVDGTKELSDFIFNHPDRENIIVYADSLLASAAYWIGSSAMTIYSYDTSYIGSIGVYLMHTDWSGLLNKNGVNVTFIQAGSKKVVGNPYKPLTDEDKRVLQERVDKTYAMFIADVARNRGESIDYVKSDMADGDIFNGVDAEAKRLIDGLILFDNLVVDLNDISTGNNAAGKINIKQEGNVFKLTVKEVEEKHPDVYKEIYDAGVESGKAETGEAWKSDLDKAKAEAIEAERNRAKEILALASDDQKELAVKLFSEGKSVEDAKTELLKNAQAVKDEALKKFAADAPAPVENIAVENTANDDIYLNDEKLVEKYDAIGGRETLVKHLAEWRKDVKLQKEYGGKCEAYLAYRRNVNEEEK